MTLMFCFWKKSLGNVCFVMSCYGLLWLGARLTQLHRLCIQRHPLFCAVTDALKCDWRGFLGSLMLTAVKSKTLSSWNFVLCSLQSSPPLVHLPALITPAGQDWMVALVMLHLWRRCSMEGAILIGLVGFFWRRELVLHTPQYLQLNVVLMKHEPWLSFLCF